MIVVAGLTVIVPVAATLPHPPVKGMLYVKTPTTLGIPLIVILLLAKVAVTPVGKPVLVTLIPVAPVVVCSIAVNAVLIQTDLGVPAVTVFFAVTVTNAVVVQPFEFL